MFKSRFVAIRDMKVTYTSIHPVATWKWDTSSDPHYLWRVATDAPSASSSKLPKELFKFGEVDDDDDEDDDVCGICRLAYEACCPTCKVPGDDCPLIWGECKHIFHMHCLLKWLETESSKQACPMDRRPWVTADRKPDTLPTTTTGEPVEVVPPGVPPTLIGLEDGNGSVYEEEEEEEVEGVEDEDEGEVGEHDGEYDYDGQAEAEAETDMAH